MAKITNVRIVPTKYGTFFPCITQTLMAGGGGFQSDLIISLFKGSL